MHRCMSHLDKTELITNLCYVNLLFDRCLTSSFHIYHYSINTDDTHMMDSCCAQHTHNKTLEDSVMKCSDEIINSVIIIIDLGDRWFTCVCVCVSRLAFCSCSVHHFRSCLSYSHSHSHWLSLSLLTVQKCWRCELEMWISRNEK